MTHTRRPARRGDGSAVVDGWVAIYTLGLPRSIRDRRREEVAGHLADEHGDAVRRGELATLRRRRLLAWVLGIPDDLAWRLTDARAASRSAARWVPASRWSGVLLAVVGIGALGAFGLVVRGLSGGSITATTWPPPAPQAFLLGCLAIGAGTVLAFPWPRLGVALVTLGSIVGFAASPWSWGCYGLALIAVVMRWSETRRAVSA